ncbi:cation:proton antiporter [Curtanaerobium respiraculi]|uniref:cation:proton antiporter n=1 Tax=Curtanaerobium respiraculi TaxID=2949669 RepID=UPI0024B3973B|nr:sodium:proton antiporter [Curtanaerobium respiraculi]
MQTFELVLFLLAAVLISAVLERVIPRVSLPLIQIALGVAIGMMATDPIQINFDPSFFLVVFIAPLLFRDAKESDKLGLVRHRQAILSLAVGLVVAIMLAVGFSVHVLEPSIPLAAALALGAALGPTDAVAVASLTNTAEPNRKESALLSGEALINDASGVVAFQFAVSAAVTGTFAVASAAADFAFAFVGGILFGIALGWFARWIMKTLDRMGLDSTTFHVMFDVTLPFLIYLLSEIAGVSGILAVVAAGIVISLIEDRTIGPKAAQLSIVSTSVWNVLAFGLNGIVFTLLGMELPLAMQGTWSYAGIDNFTVVGYVVAITAILVVTRFVWVLGLEYFGRDLSSGKRRHRRPGMARSALVTTIGGPKGAVTLSVVLSTPYTTASGVDFPQRDLIIFLASGTILLTLLLANFLLPVLAPKSQKVVEDEDDRIRSEIDIFRRVIERLTEARTEETSAATHMVVQSYNDRIARAQNKWDLETVPEAKLQAEVITHQIGYLEALVDEGKIDDIETFHLVRRLRQIRGTLTSSAAAPDIRHLKKVVRRSRRALHHWLETIRIGRKPNSTALEIKILGIRESIRYLNHLLRSNDDRYPAELITRVCASHRTLLAQAERKRPSITSYARTADKTDAIERLAYNIELEEIQDALEAHRITKATAKHMRDNVYLMMVDLEVLDSD